VSPKSKVQNRRLASREAARGTIQDLVAGKADAYEAYRYLYRLWCANNEALQELRPLFRIEGIDPDGHIIVTVAFREQVLSLANKILPQFSN
jgi:hypothetical protein